MSKGQGLGWDWDWKKIFLYGHDGFKTPGGNLLFFSQAVWVVIETRTGLTGAKFNLWP